MSLEKFQMSLMHLSFTLLKPAPSPRKEPSETVPSNTLRGLTCSEVTSKHHVFFYRVVLQMLFGDLTVLGLELSLIHS